MQFIQCGALLLMFTPIAVRRNQELCGALLIFRKLNFNQVWLSEPTSIQ